MVETAASQVAVPAQPPSDNHRRGMYAQVPGDRLKGVCVCEGTLGLQQLALTLGGGSFPLSHVHFRHFLVICLNILLPPSVHLSAHRSPSATVQSPLNAPPIILSFLLPTAPSCLLLRLNAIHSLSAPLSSAPAHPRLATRYCFFAPPPKGSQVYPSTLNVYLKC